MSLLLRSPGPWARDELWRRARAVPGLDLRFADTKSLIDVISGQNLITFTRASSGTYVGSDGLIKTAVTNEPRFDHNPTTGESLGLLVEEQRTNLLLRSNDFSTTWFQSNVTPTYNTSEVADPAGGNTATKFVAGSSGALGQGITQTAIAHTASIYLRTNTGTTTVDLLLYRNTPFGLVTSKTVTVTTSWQRFDVTGTFLDNTSHNFQINFGSSKTVYAWSAQLEPGSSPTSYIPTTTSAVTRSADVPTIEGANFSRWYRQGEGTWFVAYDQPAIGGSIAVIDDGTTANAIVLFTSSVAAQRVSSNMLIASANQGRLDAGGTFVANDINKAALAVSAGGRGLSCNGSVVVTSANPSTMPTLNRLAIQGDSNFSIQKGDHIRRLIYWPQRLDNSILQSLTR